MILGKVIGNVISVIKYEEYNSLKLMVVAEVDMEGKLKKNFFISVDLIGSGVGEIVMVANGTGVRSSDDTKDKGIDSIIIAKIEKVIFENRVISF